MHVIFIEIHALIPGKKEPLDKGRSKSGKSFLSTFYTENKKESKNAPRYGGSPILEEEVLFDLLYIPAVGADFVGCISSSP